MQSTKKGTLSKLYFLRALLSKLSKCKSECDAIEKELVALGNERFVPGNAEVAKTGTKHEQDMKRALESLKKREEALKHQLTRHEERYEHLNRAWKPGDLIGNLVLILLCATAIVLLTWWWIAKDFSVWVGVLSIPFSLLLLLFAIGAAFTCGPKAHEKNREHKKERIEKTCEALAVLIDQTARLEDAFRKPRENTSAPIDEIIKKEYEAFCEEIKVKRRELFGARDTLLNEGNAIYSMMKELSPIDESDWKNLDIILYELESHRADTLKEALQQTDLYVRHNEVRRIMQHATLAVCSVIEGRFDTLSNSIDASLNVLRGDIKEANAHLSKRAAELISTQELSRALLEKAAISSETLSRDLEELRRLHQKQFYET